MKLSILLAIAMSAAGCAEQRGLTSDALASLKGRQLTTTVRRPPALFLNIPEAYWLLWRPSVLGMAMAGERFVSENAIVDPAFQIARTLGDGLGQGFGLRPSPPVLDAVDDEPTKGRQPIPAGDLILEVWTDNWSLEPFPYEDSRFRVRYVVNMRLVDARGKHPVGGAWAEVLAQASCTCVSEDASLAPSYDELVADHAHRVKSELDTAAEFCVEDFRSKILPAAAQP
jgi:hypothetical protein